MFGLRMGGLGRVGSGLTLTQMAANIRAAYSASPQVWYDPSDFTTLFQDSAGTTPVTALGQPVGRMLDKSGKGNHLIQATPLSRPTIQARTNALINTGLSGAVAGTPGTAPTSWPFTLSAGTTDSTTVSDGDGGFVWSASVVAGRHFVSQTAPSMGANSVWDFTITLASVTGAQQVQSLIATATLPAGATTAFLINNTVVAGTVVPSSGDVIGIRITVGATAGTVVLRFGLGAGGAVTGSASFAKASFVRSEQRNLPYQRVTTATDYQDIGAPRYLSFDGSDDGMVSAANFDMSSTDAVTVCAGVRKLSDAARGAVVELTASAAANNGAFLLAAPNAASATIAFESKGTALTDAVVSTGVAAPATRVLSGLADISADSNTLRVNGSVGDTDAGDQGTGNYSNALLYLGRRGGTTLPFNGNLYGLQIIGATLTAAEVSTLERFNALKTGEVSV